MNELEKQYFDSRFASLSKEIEQLASMVYALQQENRSLKALLATVFSEQLGSTPEFSHAMRQEEIAKQFK